MCYRNFAVMRKIFCVIFTIRILWFTEFITVVKAFKFEAGATLTSVGADIWTSMNRGLISPAAETAWLCVSVFVRACVDTITVNTIHDILALLRRQPVYVP